MQHQTAPGGAALRWFEGRLVGFDVETTGTDPNEARIVTAAVAVCGGGVGTETLSLLADPGVEIPEEAAAVHGVTTERARAEGLPAAEVVGTVVDTLETLLQAARPLVIFNARYDLTVLDREARRHGLVPLQDRVALLVVDPFVIDKWLDRYRKGSRKLDAICARYGATLDGAHAADADAVAATRAAWVLGAKGAVVRRAWNPEMEAEKAGLVAEWERVRWDLAALHAAQAGWAAEQAAGLADYWREKIAKGEEVPGDPDEVRGEWPLVPFEEAARV